MGKRRPTSAPAPMKLPTTISVARRRLRRAIRTKAFPTTLGSSGGVFGNGFFPGNYTSIGNPY